MKPLLLAALLFAAPAFAGDFAPPQPQKIADDVWLLAGTYPDGRQPDGNTLIWKSPEGLVVMDTGRHPEHIQAILDFARAQNLPVVAILNSHWHLDHTSGNRAIKTAYPDARLYTGTAVLKMIAEVFPDGVKRSQATLDAGGLPDGLAEDIRLDIETRKHPQFLTPDVPVTSSGDIDLGGRTLAVELAPNAATDGDVWVFDAQSGVLASGDLVTFPVPFLDTACTQGWSDGLAAILAMPFTTLVPGHGAPMTRVQVQTYKAAFDTLIACTGSSAEVKTCGDGWAAATDGLQTPADPRSAEMAGEYVDFLRQNGGNAPRCAVR